MTKKQEKLLEEYLWELTYQIDLNIDGLPRDWLNNRMDELVDIFPPIKKRKSKK